MLDALCILCAYVLGLATAYFIVTRKKPPVIQFSTSSTNVSRETIQAPAKQGRLGKRTIYLTPEREAEKAKQAKEDNSNV